MRKRKLLTLLLAVAMLVTMAFLVTGCETADDPVAPAEPTPADPTDPAAPEPEPVDPGEPGEPVDPLRANTLIVGYNVAALGDFIFGFSIGAYDQTIWELLHGGVNTVAINNAGLAYVNMGTVSSYTSEYDAAGNKTYTFTINQGLLWSDGTEITAQDFVGAVLWRQSGQWIQAGAGWDADEFQEILGSADWAGSPIMSEAPDGWYDDQEQPEDWYDDQEEPEDWDEGADGAWEPTPWEPEPYEPEMIGWDYPSDYFAGVQLIDDYTFSLTIDAYHLPYFFELGLVFVPPIPMHVYLPGGSVVSGPQGSRFDIDHLDAAHEIANNFRFAPSVVAGPYTFVSFVDGAVTLQRNPLFAGDSQGLLPSIEFIQQIVVPEETDIDMLFAGEVDLLPDQLEDEKIMRVLANPDFAAHEYLRFGYGVVNFQHYGTHLPVADVNVRWALAHVMDRQAVLDAVLGGRGSLIDTEASPGQWMWQARGSEVLATIRPIALNIAAANDFLDETVWVFEADGSTPFDREQANAQGTYLRHNAAGEPLVVRNGAANAAVGDAIFIETVSNAAMAGMQFTNEFVDWVTIVGPNMNTPWLIPEEEMIFSTFSMGWGFGWMFDPYLHVHSDFNGTSANPAFADDIIDDATVRMRNTAPEDLEGFLEAWFDYVVRFNEVLPSLPLYNNMWMDVYNPRLRGMENVTDAAGRFSGWAGMITSLSFEG